MEPKITTKSEIYSMLCRAEIRIDADPIVIWKILTDAQSYPRWNSTVTKIDGEIRDGSRICIYVPGSKRTFSPTVSGASSGRRMEWNGGLWPFFKGQRAFEISARLDGTTHFTMQERFSGIVFAMVKGMLPDFGPIFSAFVVDLKAVSERQSATLALLKSA